MTLFASAGLDVVKSALPVLAELVTDDNVQPYAISHVFFDVVPWNLFDFARHSIVLHQLVPLFLPLVKNYAVLEVQKTNVVGFELGASLTLVDYELLQKRDVLAILGFVVSFVVVEPQRLDEP